MPKIPSYLCSGKFLSRWLILLALCLVLGCASAPRVPIENSQKLREKEGLMASFDQYWNYVAGKEVNKTFTCEVPYAQEMVSLANYRLYMNLLVKADLQRVEVLGMSCEKPFLCCIDCRLTLLKDGRESVRNLRDCWVKVQSGWYHVFKNPIFFPMLGKADGAVGAASG